MTRKFSKKSARILLFAVFAARGTSFLFSKTLMNSMPPMSILAVRFLLSFVILAAVFHRKMRDCSRDSLRGGVILGVLYTICMVFEMYGLRLIDSGTSSLIENMAIILVHIYEALLTRTFPRKKTMFCAVLAVIGVGCLTITQNGSSGHSLGILLALCAALTYASCIMTTEKVSRNGDPLSIGIIQLGVMGVLSLILALAGGSFSLALNMHQWALILALVLLCSCFGFAFQPVGQKYLSAEEAAVYTVVNPLTASILGVVAAGEDLSAAKMIGYVLILGALTVYHTAWPG